MIALQRHTFAEGFALMRLLYGRGETEGGNDHDVVRVGVVTFGNTEQNGVCVSYV